MIDKQLWDEQEQFIFEQYGYRCVLCGFQSADVLHEEPPRSLNPNWREEPWTRYPLCAAHHDTVTSMNRYQAEQMLLDHERIYARDAIKRIKEKYERCEVTE